MDIVIDTDRSTFTGLSDLPIELHLKIYSFLPLSDLITMWDVNEYFRAVMMLDLRLQRRSFFSTVVLKHFHRKNNCDFRVLKDSTEYVRVEGLSMILRFIRIFRLDICHLIINFTRANEFRQQIIFGQAVNFCVNNNFH